MPFQGPEACLYVYPHLKRRRRGEWGGMSRPIIKPRERRIYGINLHMNQKIIPIFANNTIAMSKVCMLHHIVFATKNRENTLPDGVRDDLYRLIWNFFIGHNCKLIRIGGIENHIHILVDLNPMTALATLMQELKSITSIWLKRDARFPDFKGWCKEYFADSLSWKEKDGVIEYIKNQTEHHKTVSLDNEFVRIFQNSGQYYHPNDLK